MIIEMKKHMPRDNGPAHINAIEWHQSMGYARQACARIFRDGGTPDDALKSFGVKVATTSDWSRAVELIAQSLIAAPARRVA